MTERQHLVVHLFGTLNRGGAEMRTLELVREDAKTGGRHLLVALSGRVGELDRDFREIGCQVMRLRLGLSFPIRFVQVLRSLRPSHVHSHVHLASTWFLMIARIAGVPERIAHIRTEGDGREPSIRRRLYRWVSRTLLPRTATEIVAVSESSLRATGLEGVARARVIYNCTAVGRTPTRSARDDQIKIAFVGRLDPDKNPVRAIHVFGRFRDRFPNCTLDVAGDVRCSEGGPAQQAVADLGLVHGVQFLGIHRDVRRLLAESDVLLMTTRREGLPGVLIESLAEGTPVVASAIAPVEEVAARTTGVITMPLDADDDAWAEALAAAITNWGRPAGRAEIQRAFEASPFAWNDATVAAALSVWRAR